MTRYILRRLGMMAISLFFIVSLTFFMMKVIPGGPFSSEKRLPPAIQQNINEKYDLDDPWHLQYKDYLIRTIKLDFGPSLKYEHRSVNQIIAEGFPVSVKLGMMVIIIALLAGINLGILAALKHKKYQDYFVSLFSAVGISIPSFIIAYILLYILAYQLRLVPPAMWGTWKHMVMPVISLAILPTAVVARLTRASLIEVLQQDYILMARAKGLNEKEIIYRHALPNSLIPVVAYLGPLAAAILTGSFIIEHIFSIPGLGQYFVTAVQNRDYTLIMGTTVFYSLMLMFVNLFVDILYTFIDPRVKLYK